MFNHTAYPRTGRRVALGLILEKATGSSLADLIQDRIAKPLGLTDTYLAGPARGDFVDATWINDSTEWAAGGVVSTAADWARFQTALISGKLLPPALLAEMETTVSEGADTANRYGLGLERVVTPCGAVWGHVGQVPGYSSENYTDDTGRRTVAVFATTIFSLAEPMAAQANQNLINAAVCTMLDKPIPASAVTSVP